MGCSELISCFVLLTPAVFALPGKMSLYHPISFLTFALLILSPIPPQGSEREAGVKPQQMSGTEYLALNLLCCSGSINEGEYQPIKLPAKNLPAALN